MSIANYKISTVAAWVGRVIASATQFFIIREWASRLDVEYFSILGLMLTLQGWLVLSDFQFGLASQNAIAANKAKEKRYAHFVAASFLIGLILSVIFCIIWVTIVPYVSPFFLYKYNSINILTANRTLQLGGVLMIVSACSQISYKTWMGEGRGYLTFLLPALAQVIGLIIMKLYPFPNNQEKVFAISVFVWFGVLAIVPLVCAILLTIKLRLFRFSWKILSVSAADLWSQARPLALFSLLGAGVLYADLIVLSLVGAKTDIAYSVSLYFLMAKIFGVLFFVFNAMLTSSYPVVSGYYAIRDTAGIKRVLGNLIASGVAIVVSGSVVIYFSIGTVFNYLAPEHHYIVPSVLFFGFFIYQIIGVWQGSWAMVLASTGNVSPLLRLTPFQVIITIGSMYFLTKIFGVSGVIFGLVFGSVCTTCWYLPSAALNIISRRLEVAKA